MIKNSSAPRLAIVAALFWIATAGAAYADTVRVLRDQTTVWRGDAPGVVLTVVAAGTVLEVVGTQGAWLRVRIPASVGNPDVIGLILASAVTPVSGPGQPVPAKPGQPGAKPATPRPRGPGLLIRGFGQFGFMRFTATQTFNAIFDTDTTWIPGAGVQAIWPNGSFASAEAEFYELTGQRAFINNGQVFRLGIEDEIRVIPISATFGYQFLRQSAARPYAGAGFGVHLYRERSQFAQTDEDVSERFAAFHVVAGVDFLTRQHVSAAIEAQYTAVRDSIGESGVSQVFEDKDLGGFVVRMKILIH